MLRVQAALLIIAVEIVSSAVLKHCSGFYYFIVCGLFETSMFIVFHNLQQAQFIRWLKISFLVGLIFQFIGWILYESYIKHYCYDTLIAILNLARLIILLWVGNVKNNFGSSLVHNSDTRLRIHSTKGKS